LMNPGPDMEIKRGDFLGFKPDSLIYLRKKDLNLTN